MAVDQTSVKWGFIDSWGLKEYAGVQYTATAAVSQAAAETFVGILAGMSEAGVCRIEAAGINSVEGTPTGDNASNYVANLVFKEVGGDWKPPITILGVKESLLVRDGRELRLNDASVAAVKAALATLTGKTFVLKDNTVYSRRR